MIIKEKLKNLVGIINRHKLISIMAVGLAGLVSVTSLKENVHFGAVRLHNPQGNHYAWGIWPTIGVKGEKDENIKGDFYSIGLFIGANNVEPNSTITGNMKAYGLFIGANNVEPNSTITGNMKAYGLFGGTNSLGDNSTITGNMKAYGLLVGENNIGENSTITGNIDSKGIVSITPMGTKFGSNVEIGLKNYVVKKEEEKIK